MRVLLADDHRLLLEGMQNLLEAHNIEVAGTAANGLEAVSQARELKPDVILMDIRMPVCDGLMATRLIKAELPEVNIVMLTTSDEDADLFEAVKSGASGYLLKSMDTDDLVEALYQSLQGTPPFSPGLARKLLAEFARVSKPAAVQSPTEKDGSVEPTAGSGLTQRQIDVLQLLSQGLSYKEAGFRLSLSASTVKYHMAEIMDRLHLDNRAQVLAYAGRLGLKDDKSSK